MSGAVKVLHRTVGHRHVSFASQALQIKDAQIEELQDAVTNITALLNAHNIKVAVFEPSDFLEAGDDSDDSDSDTDSSASSECVCWPECC